MYPLREVSPTVFFHHLLLFLFPRMIFDIHRYLTTLITCGVVCVVTFIFLILGHNRLLVNFHVMLLFNLLANNLAVPQFSWLYGNGFFIFVIFLFFSYTFILFVVFWVLFFLTNFDFLFIIALIFFLARWHRSSMWSWP